MNPHSSLLHGCELCLCRVACRTNDLQRAVFFFFFFLLLLLRSIVFACPVKVASFCCCESRCVLTLSFGPFVCSLLRSFLRSFVSRAMSSRNQHRMTVIIASFSSPIASRPSWSPTPLLTRWPFVDVVVQLLRTLVSVGTPPLRCHCPVVVWL